MINQILIIEPADATINMIRWILPSSFSLIIAKNDQEIQHGFQHSIPDIVIADISIFNPSLPIYKELLHHPNSENIQLLYLVEKEQLSLHEQLLTKHSSHYLLKPLMQHELKLRLSHHLKQKQPSILTIGIESNTIHDLNQALSQHQLYLCPVEVDAFVNTQLDQSSTSAILIDIHYCSQLETPLLHQLLHSIQTMSIPSLAIIGSSAQCDTPSVILQYCQDFIMSPIDDIDLKTRILKLQNTTHHSPVTRPHSPTSTPPPSAISYSSSSEPSFSATDDKSLLDSIQLTMNHEIKNPLTSIVVGAQTLKAKSFKLTATEKKLIDEIERSAHRIKLVVDNIKTVHSHSTATTFMKKDD